MNPIPCRICLLRDQDGAQLYQLVRDYINTLPESERTADAAYEERLALCRLCDRLSNGMCALCGCFVEARAAKAAQHCPARENKW